MISENKKFFSVIVFLSTGLDDHLSIIRHFQVLIYLIYEVQRVQFTVSVYCACVCRYAYVYVARVKQALEYV